MNDKHDWLESELSALRPQPISNDLRRRIAERLTVNAPTRPVRTHKSALACCLTAVCLLMIVVTWDQVRFSDSVRLTAGRNISDVPIQWEPTLLKYQRALARSSDDLPTLFNRPVIAMSAKESAVVRISAFTHSNATVQLLLGDN